MDDVFSEAGILKCDVFQGSILETFLTYISDALHDLEAFVQFKKREKHPWRSINFSKVAGFSLQLY